jgi:hypothetical protein
MHGETRFRTVIKIKKVSTGFAVKPGNLACLGDAVRFEGLQ